MPQATLVGVEDVTRLPGLCNSAVGPNGRPATNPDVWFRTRTTISTDDHKLVTLMSVANPNGAVSVEKPAPQLPDQHAARIVDLIPLGVDREFLPHQARR